MLVAQNKENSLHKAQLLRLLIHICDNHKLSKLYFKGGTCAAMLGYLDRFSVDLDFDFVGKQEELKECRSELKKIFLNLNLEIKDESKNTLQFLLRYKTDSLNDRTSRSIVKIDITFPPTKSNSYKVQFLPEINRTMVCQEIETMFANKLVAVIDRYNKNNSIAARDIFDIHHFFISQHDYNAKVIEERTGKVVKDYLQELKDFIQEKVNNRIIDQDLNFLLPYDKFKEIKKSLKEETLVFLANEVSRIGNKSK